MAGEIQGGDGLYLVALDNSSRARDVLDAALTLAKATGAKLHLFRAVGVPTELPVEAYALPPDGLEKLLVERARRDVEQIAAGLPAGVVSGVHVDLGPAWKSICSLAHQLRVN